MTGSVQVVGTAHVGERSREEVREAIRESGPDFVAVELDWRRYCSLRGSAGSGFGGDMLAAVEEAERQGIPVALIDRDVGITLRRVWRTSSVTERLRIGAWILLALLGVGGARDVDEVLEGSVEDYVERVRGVAPGAAEALIDERDALMASRLLELRSEGDVVAVVGAGHEKGVRRYLDDPESLPEVTTGAAADVYELGGEVLVVIDLPGCRPESVETELRGEELLVKAGTERVEGEYLVLGRGFRRRVRVGVPGCSEVVETDYSGGVLEVRLGRGNSIEVG